MKSKSRKSASPTFLRSPLWIGTETSCAELLSKTEQGIEVGVKAQPAPRRRTCASRRKASPARSRLIDNGSFQESSAEHRKDKDTSSGKTSVGQTAQPNQDWPMSVEDTVLMLNSDWSVSLYSHSFCLQGGLRTASAPSNARLRSSIIKRY